MPLQAHLKSSSFTIGKLAEEVGLQPSAIRYYESCGLMPIPPRTGGRRTYGIAELKRLRLLRLARSLGFTMRELIELNQKDSAAWRQAASDRIAEIHRSIGELTGLAAQLELLASCNCQSDRECSILKV